MGPIPSSINEQGVVVGFSPNCNADTRGFRWFDGPTFTLLPVPLGLTDGRALDVNDSNQIVGWHELTSGPIIGRRGYLFDSGAYTDLGSLPNAPLIEALAINDLGQVCGLSFNPATGPLNSFIWEHGVMKSLAFPIGPNSTAFDINNHGQIVGWMGDAPIPPFMCEAFIWRKGEATRLEIPKNSLAGTAMRISDTGQIAGRHFIEVSSGVYRRRGFHWKDGVSTDLGILSPYNTIDVTGINDRGEIVGMCVDSHGEVIDAPFIWRDGVMTDLRTLVDLPPNVVIDRAWDINNQGQIAAEGRVFEEETINVGFRLTPRSSVSGDYDCNHLVNVEDLLGVLNHWGPAPGSGPADLNRDGVVDPLDLLMVIRGWTLE